MKHRRAAVSLAVVFSVGAFALSGCGNDGDTDLTTAPTTTAAPTDFATVPAPVTTVTGATAPLPSSTDVDPASTSATVAAPTK